VLGKEPDSFKNWKRVYSYFNETLFKEMHEFEATQVGRYTLKKVTCLEGLGWSAVLARCWQQYCTSLCAKTSVVVHTLQVLGAYFRLADAVRSMLPTHLAGVVLCCVVGA
jgi:hypothetical protein